MSDREIAARFAAQMLGVEISDEPPPPDSPLGRLVALEKQRPITAADVAAVLGQHDQEETTPAVTGPESTARD
jgi:hypothetical protein